MTTEPREEAAAAPAADDLSLPSVDDLLSRCQRLLSEVERFQEHLEANNYKSKLNVRHFKGPLQSEIALLSRIRKDGSTTNKSVHSLRSSNVPFFEAVWATTKSSKRVVALRKQFSWKSPSQTGPEDLESSTITHRFIADVVAEEGAEWIKVSTISEKRVLFEIAKQGWDYDDSSDEGESGGSNIRHAIAVGSDPQERDGISLLQIAETMKRAARTHRVYFKHPRIKLVLPNIFPGRVNEIDAVLAEVRAKGCDVVDGSSANLKLGGPENAEPDIESALERLTLSYEHPNISKTLNVDCTDLLALISDLSHNVEVEPQPWFNDFIRAEVEVEYRERLLKRHLYPIIADRKLVCTNLAAQCMRRIARDIGTDEEKRRTILLLGDENLSQEETRKQWNELSDYTAPTNWQIPVEVVDPETEDPNHRPVRPLPRVSKKCEEELSPINQSVFLYGWSRGFTTLTRNAQAVKQIEKIMKSASVIQWFRENEAGAYDSLDDIPEEEFEGPDVYVTAIPRSLIGKDKGREERKSDAEDTDGQDEDGQSVYAQDTDGQDTG
ncbi:MAG: hypothetical protein M1831_004336 [Alyxoria varia]|nr:MAG: hypothetical protein M1831_004336 [Alyxoria varia]